MKKPMLALCLALLLHPGLASASLIGQTIGIRLTDGAALDLADAVLVGAGAEITPGDGSGVGSVLLPNESIDVGAFLIELVLEEGASDGTTGLPAGSRYVFSSLDFGDPLAIVAGVSVTLENVTGVALGSQVFFTDRSVTLYVDTLQIGDLPGAIDIGRVALSLEIVLVPEPGTLALLGLGLASLAGARRMRRLG